MFSMTTEYALRAAVFLSEWYGEVQTAGRVAEATQTPVRYASRVLQLLVEGGLATSQRGPTGGFALSREPSQITLLDVVQAIEPIQRIRDCPLGLAEHADQLCPLHRAMDAVAAKTEATLGALTLADVMTQQVVPLGISIRSGKATTFPAQPPKVDVGTNGSASGSANGSSNGSSNGHSNGAG
ncbi:MAG: Rrf2 family transcriptional regulator [Phycisphaerales bacterium]|nr:Rrf2 family transcriptional regulator [Phycisphaerales bacterium]